MSNLDFLDATDQGKVREWRVKWDEILRESVIADLHIGSWWPYTAITTERMARLGVQTEKPEAKAAWNDVVRAGRIDLIPRRDFNPIVNAAYRARANLYRYSMEGLGGYMIPATSYPTWKARHEEAEKDFWAGVASLCDNLDALKEQMRSSYVALFTDAWERLNRVGAVTKGCDEFVAEAVADLMKEVPSAEVVRSKFYMTVEFRHAPMQDELAQAEIDAARIRGDYLTSNDALDDEKRRILREMQDRVATQMEARRSQVEQSLAKAEDEFYVNIQKAVAELSDGLKSKGKLSGGASQKITGLVEKVRALNVFNDARLNQQMDELAAGLEQRTSGTGASKKDAIDVLQWSLAETEKYVKSVLAEMPTRRGVRVVESADDLGSEEVSATRRSTKVEDAPELGEVASNRRTA